MTTESVRLSRAALAATGWAAQTPPVRIVHFGLGAFHRAHQAWYTANAADAAQWGIAAFTGRSAAVAEQLAPQDGLFTLLERSDSGDVASIVPSLVEAVDGADLGRLAELLASEQTAIVTLTITEGGYRLSGSGDPLWSDEVVAADVEWLRDELQKPEPSAPAAAGTGPQSTLARLLLGLDLRRRASGAPIAIVPCDNIPDNGEFVRQGLVRLAFAVSAPLAEWIAERVSFVSTSVDRITPRTTDADIATAERLTGWADASPVVTEPFRDWVLSGEFPLGRPDWESAGARFVEDIEPFERRKLWLLNGAHSLLAYAGRLAGHATVAEAIRDDRLRESVIGLWEAASHHLPSAGLDLDRYCDALLERFGNSRIEHRLEQIGMEGVTKLRVRIAPIARAERAAGRDAHACAVAIAAWISLLTAGESLPDSKADEVQAALGASDPARALLALIDDGLAADEVFADLVCNGLAVRH